LQGVLDLLTASVLHKIDFSIADKFGEVRAGLLDQGLTVGEMDLLNASTALIQNLTMVTHNTQDYAAIPGLTLDDWLNP
jgi:tRNA(fMet)-specific endonuclease VapC